MNKAIVHYSSFKKIPEHLKTKTQWKELGYKPIDTNTYSATATFRTPGGRKTVPLYSIDECVEIKKRKPKVIEITPINLAEALYQINKSAKVSRDTKKLNYSISRHDVVKRSKKREQKLYLLKNEVMDKLYKEGYLKKIGYHIQAKYVRHYYDVPLSDEEIKMEEERLIKEYYDLPYIDITLEEYLIENLSYFREECEYKKEYTYLLTYEIEGFCFHNISDQETCEHLPLLGEIDIITSDRTRKVSINFIDSVHLLERYLGKTMNELWKEYYGEEEDQYLYNFY